MTGLPLRVCIAGIGGFAAAHHNAVRQLESEGVLQLVATCDPRLDILGPEVARHGLRERGVMLFKDFDSMLDAVTGRCELMTIATPIFLHAPMHAACVGRQIACYLEKPPTLCPQELEGMIEVDRSAQIPTQVGFSYTVEDWRQKLKTRIVEGEFGRVRSVSFLGAWNRGESYFSRATWAGKLRVDGRLVLDSCFGNAMSHHAHQALFCASAASVFSWAVVERVRAELYRGQSIEGADTVFSEAVTADGVVVRAAMSHACKVTRLSEEHIECERARIRILPHAAAEISYASGKFGRIEIGSKRNILLENIRHFVGCIIGKNPRPVTTLADSRPFVCWNALNYIAARSICEVPSEFCAQVMDRDAQPSRCIVGVEDALRKFVDGRGFPSTSGVEWGRAGGLATLDDLPKLQSAISLLLAERQEFSSPVLGA